MELFDGKYTNQIIDLMVSHPKNEKCIECGNLYIDGEIVPQIDVLVTTIKKRKYGKLYKKLTSKYKIRPVGVVRRKWVLERFCCEGCYKKWTFKTMEDLQWLQQGKKLKKQITTALRKKMISSLQEVWKLLPKELKQEKISQS